MPFRFITKSIHAYLIDYPVALVLMVAPFLLKLGQSGPVALWLSVVTRVTALLLPALTDHPTGLVRVIPYWLHLWVDRALGVVFIIAPFAFHFTGLDAWYYWVLAAAVLLTTSVLNAPSCRPESAIPVATRRMRHIAIVKPTLRRSRSSSTPTGRPIGVCSGFSSRSMIRRRSTARETALDHERRRYAN
jgi:hypothetical protein